MLLHNENIARGDSVYDYSRGYGRAVTIGESFVTIEFSGGLQFPYRTDGTSIDTGVQSLYWQNPFVVVPPKNQSAWEAKKAVLLAVNSLLGS